MTTLKQTTSRARPLLSVQGLSKHFPVFSKGFFRRQTGLIKACDDVSFDLQAGETLGLVGESGCGKTTTGRAILRALTPTSGRVLFDARAGVGSGHDRPAANAEPGSVPEADGLVDLAVLPARDLKPLRTRMQMVFQDPFSSLNPRMTIRDIVGEPLVIHRLARGRELEDRVADVLQRVGLKPEHMTRYPHAFSGGQRQRIGIARALIMRPSLIVCDEAVSALDVSVQAQVINLLQDLQQEFGLTYVFIAHDLSVVKHICDRIAVMYAGRVVELAATDALFGNPRHPYTRALLSAVPNPDPDCPTNLQLSGEVADTGHLPPGCAFSPRCPFAVRGQCDVGACPKLTEVAPGHWAACPVEA